MIYSNNIISKRTTLLQNQ